MNRILQMCGTIWYNSSQKMNPDDLAIILKCPLFKGIDDISQLRDIESLPHRIETYADGRIIRIRNETYNELIFVVSGALEAFQEDQLGHYLIVETFKAPAVVATAILFALEPLLPVSLKTRRCCKLLLIPRNAIFRLCTHHSPLMLRLLADIGTRTAYLAKKLHFQSFTTLRQKLAVFLNEQIELGQMRITVNKEHLAEIFGVNRPSLSRVCRELADSGIIQLEGRQLVILKPEILCSMSKIVE